MHNMKVAAVQMVSVPEIEANLATARRLMDAAVAEGAELVLLPEYFGTLGASLTERQAAYENDGDGLQQRFLSEMARTHRIYLIGGCVPVQAVSAKAHTLPPGAGGCPEGAENENPLLQGEGWGGDGVSVPPSPPAPLPQGERGVKRARSACLVYGPDGKRVARYDKIHLFKFTCGEESHDEAQMIEAGDTPTTFEAPCGRVALSICYDLRFPELYRRLGDVALIVVPAAFTAQTGRAHWEVLLRARAIENQCYVLAAGQGGHHINGRETYGHSMLIDPWGHIVSCLPNGEGIAAGTVDLERIEEVRGWLPALQHRRL